MAEAILTVDLPGPVAPERLAELGAALRGFADRCQEARPGSYDVAIEPGRLAVRVPEGGDSRARRFFINVAGPGFGDEGVFRAAHAADPDLEPLIGFTPTHDVVVCTNGGDLVDRLMVAELAAVVQDVVGGVIDVKTARRALEPMRSLPGVVALMDQQWWLRAFGSARFLRAWAAAPDFELCRFGVTPVGI
ncbi:MAG: DUF6368 family protein [Catenulispora sp.]